MSDRERVSDERLRHVADLAESPFNYHGAADEPAAIAVELRDARDRIARAVERLECCDDPRHAEDARAILTGDAES